MISQLSWRQYATAWTNDHLPRATGDHRTGSDRTIRPTDCRRTRLLSLDSTQVAAAWSRPGPRQLNLPHGSAHHWPARQPADEYTRCDLAPTPDTSGMGARYP